jgi:DNA polymerase III epsilon subunit-like protein
MNTFLVIIIVVVVLYFVFKKPSKKVNQVPTTQKSVYTPPQKSEENISISFPQSVTNKKHYFFFDCETTGLPKNRYGDESDFDNWPYPVQIAWMVMDENFGVVSKKSYILKQPVKIPIQASGLHGITTELMNLKGIDPKKVYSEFIEDIKDTTVSIAHNTAFDVPAIKCDLLRNGFTKKVFIMKNLFCTMNSTTNICKIKNKNGGYKWPKLEELYGYLFYNRTDISIDGSHDAMNDVVITAKCYIELKRRKLA